jgi:hypothetical protein
LVFLLHKPIPMKHHHWNLLSLRKASKLYWEGRWVYPLRFLDLIEILFFKEFDRTM